MMHRLLQRSETLIITHWGSACSTSAPAAISRRASAAFS
jgi:hypothetical protein